MTRGDKCKAQFYISVFSRFEGLNFIHFMYASAGNIIMVVKFHIFCSVFFRDLSNNQLSGISEGSFVKLERLEELDLAHNQISCIDRNALASLRSLRYL